MTAGPVDRSSPARAEEVDDLGDVVTVAARSLLLKGRLPAHASFFFDFQGAVFRTPPSLESLAPLLARLFDAWIDVPEGGSVFMLANVVPHRHAEATLVLQLAQTVTPPSIEVVTEVLDSDLAPLDLPSTRRTPAAPDEASLAWRALGGHVLVGDSPGHGRVVHAQVTLPVLGAPLERTAAADHGLTVWLLGGQAERFEAITRRLQRLGWRVAVMRSAAQALARLRDEDTRPSLVLGYERFGTSAPELALLRPGVGDAAVFLLREGEGGGEAAPDARVHTLAVPLSPSTLHALTVHALHRVGLTLRPRDAVGSESGRRPLALVVDDNLINQMLATAMLNLLGYDVDVASDGDQAVSQCLRSAPSIVLMDLDMPVLDGFGAARAIRSHQARGRLPPFPIVPATARSATPDVLRSTADAGMTGFIVKPLDVHVLREQMMRALRAPA